MTRTRPWSRYTHPPKPAVVRPRGVAEPGGEATRDRVGLRLFVAIELASPLLEELTRIQVALREHAPDLRFVRPETIHCTLKFLGDVDGERLGPIQRILATLEGSPAPASIALGRPGCFSGREGPRVAWCAVEGDLRGLGRLATSVDEALSRAGFERESRSYRPHLTLARFPDTMPKPEREAIAETLRQFEVESRAVQPSEMTLFSSRLQPGGSLHTPVQRYALTRN